ncbi:MAG: TIGR03009 domain-containing protein [Candidatus Nealsonbacteria bacterium]|nr:TIGR03009 domain-containing protein [Candidatus Nealsonbacteria bacterium]
MTLRIGCSAILGLLLATAATAQPRPYQGTTPGARPPARPTQPVVPQNPALRPRTLGQAIPGRPATATQLPPARTQPVQQQPAIPFRLTPQEETYLDRVLNVWEQHSGKVKTFSCDFTRFEYDPVFGSADGPRFVDEGEIKYKTPDKGMFRVLKTLKKGKRLNIEPERADHWICDGKSAFVYDHKTKNLREFKLPPDMQGKAITNGPLPFLFGAEAAKLKQRYYMRVITPPDVKDQLWLEAYPRWQQDAANFKRVELILTIKDMMPSALQTYAPNGKNRTVYQFSKLKANDNDPLEFLRGDPFRASTPLGWKKVVEQTPAEQTTRLPGVPLKR